MGFEKGSVFAYDNKLWLFYSYSTDKDHYQTYILHGLSGEIVEARADDCIFLISLSDLQFIDL